MVPTAAVLIGLAIPTAVGSMVAEVRSGASSGSNLTLSTVGSDRLVLGPSSALRPKQSPGDTNTEQDLAGRRPRVGYHQTTPKDLSRDVFKQEQQTPHSYGTLDGADHL